MRDMWLALERFVNVLILMLEEDNVHTHPGLLTAHFSVYYDHVFETINAKR